MKNIIQLRSGSWYEDREVTYKFPDNWDLQVFSVKESVPLDISKIRSNIDNPIGIVKLNIIAKPGMKVLLICDDISRPTRTDLVLPVIIKILIQTGIKREDISILISSGTHDLMTSQELDLKVGKDITDHFQVYIHNCKSGNKFIGKTRFGTPVYVNQKVIENDLVVGIGGIYPHDSAGFGGGAKLILGVCGISTILHFHRKRKCSQKGGDIFCEFRQDIMDAARLAHMDFIVNMVVNGERQIIDLVAGDTDKAFSEGIRRARPLLGVPEPDSDSWDLVIADAYPFDSTYVFMRKGWWPVKNVKEGCLRLIIAAMAGGPGQHIIFPIPGNPEINKIKLMYYEGKAFGLAYIIYNTLIPRLKLALIMIRAWLSFHEQDHKGAKGIGKRKPGENSEGFAMLHRANGMAKEQLDSLPYMLFDDPDKCFNYLCKITDHRPLRVVLYKNSSLTFPISK